jgi:hypothetical protein
MARTLVWTNETWRFLIVLETRIGMSSRSPDIYVDVIKEKCRTGEET